MKILYYDCFSGISGDMNLGALIDIGVSAEYLVKELKKLPVTGYELIIKRAQKMGIEGTRVEVVLGNALGEEQEPAHEQGHTHEHAKEHIHEHAKEHIHEQGEEHIHRNLADIENLIMNSELSGGVKSLSIKMFKLVAEAEGKIHGKPINEVHFHEVGAVDSIVDIVGAAICLHYLKPDVILSSPIEVGRGFVKCAHGLFPVPAPATAEILRGAPIVSSKVPFEATTPTGAAILACNVNNYTTDRDFVVERVGYGLGKKDGEVPNVLRVFLGNKCSEKVQLSYDEEQSDALMLECNIDDMNPEMYPYIIERLFLSGAADAYLTPIIMKKGRPACKISVLCTEEKQKQIKNILFEETTTLGIRAYRVHKDMLKREFVKVEIPQGEVTVKLAKRGEEIIKHKAEYDHCVNIAKKSGMTLREVYNLVEEQFYKSVEKKEEEIPGRH